MHFDQVTANGVNSNGQISRDDGLLQAVLLFQPLHIRFTQVIVAALGAGFLSGQGAQYRISFPGTSTYSVLFPKALRLIF